MIDEIKKKTFIDLVDDLFTPFAYEENDDEKKYHDRAILDRERFETPPAESIQSTKFQETVFRWTEQRVEAVQPAFWFEISRFVVPVGLLGIISRIWTHLEYLDESGEMDERITLNNPENPWFHETFLAGLGFKLRWHLRIETIRTIFDPVEPLAFISESELPGFPFGELSSWTDQRYSWGNHARNVRLLIPEGHTIRLFCGLVGNCWNDSDCQET